MRLLVGDLAAGSTGLDLFTEVDVCLCEAPIGVGRLLRDNRWSSREFRRMSEVACRHQLDRGNRRELFANGSGMWRDAEMRESVGQLDL